MARIKAPPKRARAGGAAGAPSHDVNGIDIHVVDDHQLFREGLRFVLEVLGKDVTVVEAESFGRAREFANKHKMFDLVIADLLLTGEDGFDGLKELRNNLPNVAVVVVSRLEDRNDVIRDLECGASGYIPNSSIGEVMLSALWPVFAGGVYLLRVAVRGRDGGRAKTRESRRREARSDQDLLGRSHAAPTRCPGRARHGQVQPRDRERTRPRRGDGQGSRHRRPQGSGGEVPNPGGVGGQRDGSHSGHPIEYGGRRGNAAAGPFAAMTAAHPVASCSPDRTGVWGADQSSPSKFALEVHPRSAPSKCTLTVRPHRAKWSRGRVAHRQISPIKSGPQPIVTAQGRFRGRMPIVLPLSAIGGRSHLGTLG